MGALLESTLIWVSQAEAALVQQTLFCFFLGEQAWSPHGHSRGTKGSNHTRAFQDSASHLLTFPWPKKVPQGHGIVL